MEVIIKNLIEVSSKLNKLVRRQATRLPENVLFELTEAEHKINKSISELQEK